MRGLLATTAVLGVLAIGGLPALALTLAADETDPAQEPATTLAEDTGRPGPPPWAQGRGPGEDRGDEDDGAEPEDEDGPPAWAQGEDRQPPPGWARNHPGRTPHGWAVREWALCLAEEAENRGPGERVDPETDCGGKPVSPGQAKKSGAAGQPPGLQGRSGAPGQQGRVEPPGQDKKPQKTRPEAGQPD